MQLGTEIIAKKYKSLQSLGSVFASSVTSLRFFKTGLQGVADALDLVALA